MYSDLAKADLDDLRAEGLTPTDDDIIRLHALASRITSGQETTAANFPRWATAGGVVFYEPTIAARFWYGFAKQYAEDAETEDWLFAFACANGREYKYLDTLKDPEAITCALGCFLSGVTATKAEVERAVYYVVTGGDDATPEKTELEKLREKREDAEGRDRETRNFAALEDILDNAATATGLTFAEIMEQTPSRLCAMIYAANVKAGMKMTKTSGKAHAEYLATLTAIGKRLRTEKVEAAAADVASTEKPTAD